MAEPPQLAPYDVSLILSSSQMTKLLIPSPSWSPGTIRSNADAAPNLLPIMNLHREFLPSCSLCFCLKRQRFLRHVNISSQGFIFLTSHESTKLIQLGFIWFLFQIQDESRLKPAVQCRSFFLALKFACW